MPFTWSDDELRYRTADGRLVRQDAIRSALDRVIDAQSGALRTLTQSLLDGGITLAAWQLQAMQAIKATHLVALAVAHGGWNQLDQSDFGWVGQRIRSQYSYLTKFTLDIWSGKQPLDGTAVARAALYAAAARATHRAAEQRLARRNGMLAEKNVLGEADHCQGQHSCLGETSKGWMPIGSLIPVGERKCKVNCHCRLIYRAEPAA